MPPAIPNAAVVTPDIRIEDRQGHVCLFLPRETDCVAMSPAMARLLARLLLDHAATLERTRSV
jgi:hypothetical protein